MSGLQPPLPPPPDEKMSDKGDNCRLWVGNLDTRITEFALLKLLQKYGALRKFDFLYHKSGPDQGKPRGYCFVSYHSTEEASRAIQGLNGKLALSKTLIVRWAHADKAQEQPIVKSGEIKLPVPPPSVQPRELSKESKIRLIEAKLKMMESKPNEFKLANENGEASCAGHSLDNRTNGSDSCKTRTSEPKAERTAGKPYSRVGNGVDRNNAGVKAQSRR